MLTEEQIESAARHLCWSRNESPDGEEVRYIDGAFHAMTFLECAKRDVRAIEDWRRQMGLFAGVQEQ